MSDTVFIGSARFLVDVLRHYQIEPESFIKETLDLDIEVNLNFLKQDNFRVQQKNLEKTWMRVYSVIGDECLGVNVSHLFHPGYLGALGYAWMSSDTLLDGFTRLERYIHMISRRNRIRIKETGNKVSIYFEKDFINPNLHFMTDASMAMIYKSCSLNAGSQFKVDEVHFIRPQPSCIKDFENLFQSSLYFGAKENKFVFSESEIKKPLAGANSQIAEVSDRVIIDYLAKMDESDIVDQVRSYLIKHLSTGNVTEKSVAESLFKSLRTMQRGLKERNTSFSQILNDVRKDLALKYLADNGFSLTEIGFMLGFSESSSFSRAFRRWTGSSPSKYRS